MARGGIGLIYGQLLLLPVALITLGQHASVWAAGCTGEVGGSWAEGICTIDDSGVRSEACKPCLVGAEWDQLREELGTAFVHGRRTTRLNIGLPNWNSATLLASAFRIIAEELLGYDDVATVLNGGDMTHETANAECKAVFLEVWNGGTDLEEQRALIEDEQIIMSSYLGASGHETLYVPAFMPFLSSHYRALHENIVQVMPDGSKVAAMDGFVRDGTISAANLSVFWDTPEFGCGEEEIAAWTVSECVEGRWYPEQCGDTFPSPTCAEAYMPNVLWSAGHLESAIRNLGLNFSMVYTSSDGLMEIIRKSHENKEGILYYWWEPDPLHVLYPSQKLIMPPNTPECEAAAHADPMLSGNACDTGQSLLRKFMHADMRDSDPDLFNLWEKFRFNTDEIYEFMSLQRLAGGPYNFEDAACEFLKSDTPVNWRSWVSINDFCSSYGENYEWRPEERKCIATKDRNSCIPGMYFDVASNDCRTCPPGEFTNSTGLLQCMPCQPGTACRSPGCTKCDLCPSGTYTDELAAQRCLSCPDNTHTYTLEGADRLERCVCREGFYRRDGSLGAQCYPCPDNGVCLGGSMPPHPSSGYWGDWSLVDTSTPDSKPAAQDISSRLFHRCANPASCNGCSSRNPVDEVGAELVVANAASQEQEEHACRLDPETICDSKYQGVMCAACSQGHFSIQGQCMSCPPLGWLFTLAGILLILCIWYLLNRVAAAEYDAVDLLLLYFQNASTVSTFTLGWSPLLLTVPFLVLAVVNFDVTYMSWDCLIPMQHSPVLSYGFGFGLQLALPLLLVAGYTANFLIHKLAQRLGVPTKRSLEEVLDDSIASVGAFVNLVIHTITLKCLEPLMCIEMPGNTSVLRAGPSIPCWEGSHIAFVITGVLGGLLYTVGFPALCMAVLRFGIKHNLLRSNRFQRRWGWLYLRYEREWFYWELLIMARRCALIVVAVLAVNLASIQIVLGASVCVAAMTMHFYARPFIDESLDRLEMMSLISLMILIFMGVLFTDDAGRLRFSAWDDVANVLTILSILGCIGLTLRMVYSNVRERTAIRKVSRRMRRAIQHVFHVGPEEPSAPFVSGRFKLSLSGVVKAAVSRNGEGSSLTELGDEASRPTTSNGSASDNVRDELEAEPLEIHETLDVRQIENWMSKLEIEVRACCPRQPTHSPFQNWYAQTLPMRFNLLTLVAI